MSFHFPAMIFHHNKKYGKSSAAASKVQGSPITQPVLPTNEKMLLALSRESLKPLPSRSRPPGHNPVLIPIPAGIPIHFIPFIPEFCCCCI